MSGSSDVVSASTSSKFSLSLGNKKSSSPHHSKTQQKRPHPSSALSLGPNEDDQGDGNEIHQQISSFGKGFGRDSTESAPKKEERIIPSIPDRDWQEESRRKRQKHTPAGEPPVNGYANGSNTDVDTVGGSVPKYGLNVVDRSQPATASADNEDLTSSSPNDTHVNNDSTTPPKPQTADEEALAALLGQRQQPQTVIAPPSPPPSEDQVFRDSYATAPRNCTLEEYEATPVEGYGAAILRGYLKAGQTLESHTTQRGGGEKGKAGWVPERRPGLLGLGAKESGLGVELGAWGKGAGKSRGPRPDDATYNPLARRNKKTGELMTEDELKKKIEEQGRVVLEERPADRKRDKEKVNGSRRDHEDGSSRRRERRYDDDEDESDRRHRRKERDRERRHDDDDRDRERRRHDKRESDSDRKSRHKSDRDRDRNEDSDRHRRRDRSRERVRERRKDREHNSSRR